MTAKIRMLPRLSALLVLLFPAQPAPASAGEIQLAPAQERAAENLIELLESLDSKPDALRELREQLRDHIESTQAELEGLDADSKPSAEEPAAGPLRAAEGDVDFERDIFPLFRSRCVQCHGDKNPKGGLRLDAKALVFAGGISGDAVIPGDAENSQIYRRVLGLDGKPKMPVGGNELTPEETARLKAWIDGGAEWPDRVGSKAKSLEKHWAYVKPVRPAPPDVENGDWVRTPIDRFVLARLEKEGLEPAPEASKETLIRRAYFDLTGLPPSPEEVDAFVADPRPNAYETVIDRLLDSPHYGERWAVPWLDAARYADSNGYQIDQSRSMWPYRDWVVNALNRDMPFDRFTIEQIAGDLLPNPSKDQLIATGFHRNTMINEEGGVDQEEYRVEAVLDRANTTATVWLGSTLACAQCHNHKFDPFSQKDYYEFVAFFNNTELEVHKVSSFSAYSDGPLVEVPTPEQRAVIERLKPEIEALESILDADTPALAEAQTKWEGELIARQPDWAVLKPAEAVSLNGAKLEIHPDDSIAAGGETPATDTYAVRAETGLERITAIRVEALSDGDLPNDGPGRGNHSNFVLSEIRATLSSDGGEPIDLVFINPSASFEAENFGIEKSVDGDPSTGWAVHPRRGETQEAVFEPAEPLSAAGGAVLSVTLVQNHGSQHTLGRFRLSATGDRTPVRARDVPADILATARTPADQRSDGEAAAIKRHFRDNAPELRVVRERIAELRDQWPKDIPTTLVMRELDEPRETHVFMGGSFLSPGERVYPAAPDVLPAIDAEPRGANRLDLARWLVSRENPLTARVTVNRIWQEYFGTGIVKTPEDFGVQGERPVHPGLLDWLAVEFMESGWSMKALHRLIVTSAAYRQSPFAAPGKIERDPENRLLSRGPRFRLTAEMIRDNALAASGLLNRGLGGPPVFPYQPPGLWRMPYNREKWETSEGEDRYRRGLYTHIRRTSLYPMKNNFNAPSRETACVRRPRTNTPLQALNLLNDPVFFEAARALARRVMDEAPDDVDQRLVRGFRLCTSRYPDGEELARLRQFHDEMRTHFETRPADARKVAFGEDGGTGDRRPATEWATWTLIANALLNLDETITKG